MEKTLYSTPRTLLSRTWIPASLTAFLGNIIIQTVSQYYHITSNNPICAAPALPNWIIFAHYISAVVFMSHALMIILNGMVTFFNGKMCLEAFDHNRLGISVTTLTILFIAGSSSLLTASLRWGGVCEDPFGVRAVGTRSGEWICCVPLLMYSVIGLDSKPMLNQRDKIVIVNIIISMMSSFILQLPMPYSVAVMFLTIGFVTCFISVYFFIQPSLEHPKKTSYMGNYSLGIAETDYEVVMRYKRTQDRLTFVLTLTFPAFPLVYLLSMGNVIGHDATELIFLLLNIFAKLYFATVVMDTTIDSVYKSMIYQQIAALQSRNRFINQIIQEVRLPLSSINLGLDQQLNNNSKDNNEDEKETLLMMKEASQTLGHTLMDMSVLQSFVEGTFALHHYEFNIYFIIDKILNEFQHITKNKGIDIRLNVQDNMPKCLVGDGDRIEFVIRKLLENAILFSPRFSFLDLSVTFSPIRIDHPSASSTESRAVSLSPFPSPSKVHMESRKCLVVIVKDCGPAIVNHRIPSPRFNQVALGMSTDSRGGDFNLFVSKRIVELHGGSLEMKPDSNRGMLFVVKVPLTVSREGAETEGSEDVIGVQQMKQRAEDSDIRNVIQTRLLAQELDQNKNKNDFLTIRLNESTKIELTLDVEEEQVREYVV